MLAHLRPALVLLVLMSLLTGGVYPLAVTGIAQAVVPSEAGGSLILKDGKPVGSILIGQPFKGEQWFHPRPSAAGPDGYDAASSVATNLGPLSRRLLDQVKAAIAAARPADSTAPVPADAVTSSGSGLDPHISPANALLQVARVAAARNLPEDRVRALVTASTEGRFLGFIGEPRVNVLRLNLALEGLK